MVTKEQLKKEARVEYEKTVDPAFEEYAKIADPAWRKYEAGGMTHSQYRNIEAPARAKYAEVRDPAFLKFQKRIVEIGGMTDVPYARTLPDIDPE